MKRITDNQHDLSGSPARAAPAAEAVCDPDKADGRDTRWDLHRKQRREELLAAARRAIHHEGPNISMDAIAEAANTSKSVLYRYFTDKAGLRAAISEEVVTRVHADVIDAAHQATTPAQSLDAMVHAYLAQAASSPSIYAFVMANETTHGTDVTAQARNEITDLISAGLSSLSPHGASAGLEQLWASAALGFILSAVDQWLEQSPEAAPHVEEMATALSTWLTRGVLTPFTTESTAKSSDSSHATY